MVHPFAVVRDRRHLPVPDFAGAGDGTAEGLGDALVA